MVERKEVVMDDLFIRALQNSRRAFMIKEKNGQLKWLGVDWYEYLEKEYSLSCVFVDSYYYEDEQLLSFFILKWS